MQPEARESRILNKNGVRVKTDPPSVGGGAGKPDFRSGLNVNSTTHNHTTQQQNAIGLGLG